MVRRKTPPEHPERRVTTIDGAAEFLGCTDRTIRKYIASGRLRAYRVADTRNVRIDVADVEALLVPIAAAEVSA